MIENKMVVFRVGQEEYAVSVSNVREITQYQGAIQFPNVPADMAGIINLRGKIIPVFDLAMRLGITKGDCPEKYALIIETAGQDAALIVDEVTEVKVLEESAIEALPAMASFKSEYLWGIGKEGKRILILLDVDKLFSSFDIPVLKDAG